MGYMSHHALIVTSWSDEAIKAAHAHALNLLSSYDIGELVSPILPIVTNATQTFVVGPDGSKEGWDTSDRGDDYRAKLIEYLRAGPERHHWFDWVLVQYGNDDHMNRILDANDFEFANDRSSSGE